MPDWIFYLILSAAATLVGVEIFRRVAVSRKIYDLPNERSSHAAAVPRGGGLVIVFVVLIFYAAAAYFSEAKISDGYIAGSLLIAAVSFADDLKPQPFWLRISIHSLAAAILIWRQGSWHEFDLPQIVSGSFGVFGAAVGFLWIVWLINAYNFMDGIDGIAALQAIIGGSGWLFAGVILESRSALILGCLTAGAGLGFYLHNRSPARIFMGDSGSTFLGYTFAALPFLAGDKRLPTRAILPYIGVMLVWFFMFDTVLTLLARILKKRKFWQAHREHLYQKLAQTTDSHRKVTAIYGCCALIVTLSLLSELSAGGNFPPVSLTAAIILSAILYIYTVKSGKRIKKNEFKI